MDNYLCRSRTIFDEKVTCRNIYPKPGWCDIRKKSGKNTARAAAIAVWPKKERGKKIEEAGRQQHYIDF
jgi:hypothetical protein